MWTKHRSVTWSSIRIKGKVTRELNCLSPCSFSADRSKAVPLLQRVFIRALIVSYGAFVLPWFLISSSVWCLKKAVHLDFGMSWVFAHIVSNKQMFVFKSTSGTKRSNCIHVNVIPLKEHPLH